MSSSVSTKPHVNERVLAGCISLENEPFAFGFQWHDSLIPVGDNYTAIERAVFECACAGCESIWITVNDDFAPLIKDRLKDYVYDPVWFFREYDVFPTENQKLIPIFLVPQMVKYRKKRDSPGWGIINSALYANMVGKQISQYNTPNLFYAAFSHGIYNPRELIKHRRVISNEKVVITYDDKNIYNGNRVGFTFDQADISAIKSYIIKNGTKLHKVVGDNTSDNFLEKLPASERYSARNFSLAEVFSPLKKDEHREIKLLWYHEIDSWHNYRKYMRSDNYLVRPKIFAGKRLLPTMGMDEQDDN